MPVFGFETGATRHLIPPEFEDRGGDLTAIFRRVFRWQSKGAGEI